MTNRTRIAPNAGFHYRHASSGPAGAWLKPRYDRSLTSVTRLNRDDFYSLVAVSSAVIKKSEPKAPAAKEPNTSCVIAESP
jgi:hypothetical protein